MAYQMNAEAFNRWLDGLWQDGTVFGPKCFKEKGAFSDTDRYNYGEIRTLDELVLDKKTYLSPKEMAFPIRETLFHFNSEEVTVPKQDTKPVYIFLRPCDINGFTRLDNIFLNNGPYVDPYYAQKRDRLKFILIGCGEDAKGFENCFCVSMQTNTTDQWHLNLHREGDQFFVAENPEKAKEKGLEELLKTLADAGATFVSHQNNTEFFMPQFVKENTIQVTVPPVGSLSTEIFDHPVWQEYTARCIACGRCNTSCVTCSCFTMQDVKHSDVQGERRRRWASCHVKGYSDMAGGHSFRGKNGERMRFKTMHKVNDYHKRFDTHMCVGCGRCDDVCPEYISFSKCINKLNQIVAEKEGQGHDK